MARTKKCDECKKDCIREEMVIVDYMKRNGDIGERTYCSNECANAKDIRKQLIEDTNNLMEVILEMPIRTNMYFNKLYSPIVNHYGYKVIYEMLNGEYEYLCEVLNKDFANANAKIKYFIAVMQNKIEDYKNVKEEVKDKVSSMEIVDIPETIKYNKKTKKSIFDI